MTTTIQIPLAHGKGIALIDNDDYERISAHHWYLSGDGYAARGTTDKSRKRHTVYMHREVLLATGDLVVDHINHNRLDNRRENLRSVTLCENLHHRKGPQVNNTHGFPGIERSRDQWRARIQVAGTLHELGCFAAPEEAAHAYQEALKRFFPGIHP